MNNIHAQYANDILSWSREQAYLLRSGQFDALDIENLAEEIEDVGKSEQRELESRMAVLLAHLLKWQYQAQRRGHSWEATIRTQRANIQRRIRKTPSLKADLKETEWWDSVWDDALNLAVQETNLALSTFPPSCPWLLDQIMDAAFWPD